VGSRDDRVRQLQLGVVACGGGGAQSRLRQTRTGLGTGDPGRRADCLTLDTLHVAAPLVTAHCAAIELLARHHLLIASSCKRAMSACAFWYVACAARICDSSAACWLVADCTAA
jgi:hypothetical protein